MQTEQQAPVGTYFKRIGDTAKSYWHGMSVTLSHLFRKPITTQYPDRTPFPQRDVLPARYRGFLEVDMEICSGCQACERACPIGCINVDLEKDPKNPKNRFIERFDIDIGKCMYCGLCVEQCPSGSIVHTREFEAANASLAHLTLRFVPEGQPVTPWKVVKAPGIPRRPAGSIVRELVKKWDAPAPQFPTKEQGAEAAKVLAAAAAAAAPKPAPKAAAPAAAKPAAAAAPAAPKPAAPAAEAKPAAPAAEAKPAAPAAEAKPAEAPKAAEQKPAETASAAEKKTE